MIKRIIFVVFMCVFQFSCANPLEKQLLKYNEDINNISPYRYELVEKTPKFTAYELKLAGVSNPSIAKDSEVLLQDILKGVQEKCGFIKDQLIETRKVLYKHPNYYEVWVFKDMLSERDDKTTGISVLLRSYPNDGGVDIEISGDCHAKPKKMFFGK